jgi:hypothetical protein
MRTPKDAPTGWRARAQILESVKAVNDRCLCKASAAETLA